MITIFLLFPSLILFFSCVSCPGIFIFVVWLIHPRFRTGFLELFRLRKKGKCSSGSGETGRTKQNTNSVTASTNTRDSHVVEINVVEKTPMKGELTDEITNSHPSSEEENPDNSPSIESSENTESETPTTPQESSSENLE